jgi:hypothetical protein
MTSCPNSFEAGCRCPDHHPGLLEFSGDPAGLAVALDRLKPLARPQLVAVPPSRKPACTGSMTCPCPDCAAANAARKPRDVRQPWQPRGHAA